MFKDRRIGKKGLDFRVIGEINLIGLEDCMWG